DGAPARVGRHRPNHDVPRYRIHRGARAVRVRARVHHLRLREGNTVRNRIRVLTAALGVVFALGVFAAPAFAQESGTTKSPNKASEDCRKILDGGGDLSDCQQAPSPLRPEANEIIWGSLAFLVLLVAMWKWGVPAIKNMEQAREDRIRNDLETAERTRQE